MRMTESRLKEIIKNIIAESGIERLEESADNFGRSEGITIIEDIRKYLFEHEIPYFKEEEESYIKSSMGANIRRAERDLITLILKKIEIQLDHIEDKTKKERLILDRLAPGHFSFNHEGDMYQEIKHPDHPMWKNHTLFRIIAEFKKRVYSGKYLDRLDELTNFYLDKAVEACRDLGI